MNTLIEKAKSALSAVALFTFGAVMAGLGVATVGLLALFALVAIGMAMLAAPFLAMAQPDERDAASA